MRDRRRRLRFALEALDAWLERPTRARLIRCAAAVALASQTRYPGLVLIVSVCALMVVLGPQPLRRRWAAAAVPLLVAAVPLAAWLLRNWLVAGVPFGQPGSTNLLKIHRLGTGHYFEVH